MAVTLISRPVGHKLTTIDISAQIIDSGTDTALVYTSSAHGLVDGDYVYIESNFDSYNGFKYVDSIAYDSFKIKDSLTGSYVTFKQNADITFRISVLSHGWQCVHLPIVYELQSNLFPTNNLNTPRTVTSFTNENGYTNLNLSGGLVATSTLSYVVITGAANDSLNGVFQIINQISVSDATIDLAYNAAYSFTGATVVRYYKGYFISVKVYGGLEISHPWYDEKPMELLATLKFTPDSFNNVKFSISEILKGQITLRNNLTLDTLPNNIDFYTSFYIAYSENYDASDGTTITVYTAAEAIDTFIGYATNSILPFKSESVGHLSDYINESDYLAKWLTVQDRPVAIVDHFFDLSFINQVSGIDIQIEVIKSTNGVIIGTEYIVLKTPGIGIIRVPITPATGFDQYCIQALSGVPLVLALFNAMPPGGQTWTTGTIPTVTVTSQTRKLCTTQFAPQVGVTYKITVKYTITSGTLTGDIKLGFTTISIVDLYTDSNTGVFTGSGSETFTLIGQATTHYLYIQLISSTTADFRLDSVYILSDTTEQICIDIMEECEGTFTNDNLRITEGGVFRELE